MHELITDRACCVEYMDGYYEIYFEFTRNLDRVWENCFHKINPGDKGFSRLKSISLTGYKLRVVIEEDKLDALGIHAFEMRHIKDLIRKTNNMHLGIQNNIRKLKEKPVLEE